MDFVRDYSRLVELWFSHSTSLLIISRVRWRVGGWLAATIVLQTRNSARGTLEMYFGTETHFYCKFIKKGEVCANNFKFVFHSNLKTFVLYEITEAESYKENWISIWIHSLLRELYLSDGRLHILENQTANFFLFYLKRSLFALLALRCA